MTDDSRIIWAYTEGHLREWMEGLYRYYSNGGGYHYQFPDPTSLTPEQVEELYRRIKYRLDIHVDFPDQGIEAYAWPSLEVMGIISEQPCVCNTEKTRVSR